MKVYFRVSGGFAGVNQICGIESDSLGKPAQESLTALLAAYPDGNKPDKSIGCYDQFIYEICVTQDSQRWAYMFDEANIPTEAIKLVHELETLTRDADSLPTAKKTEIESNF